MQQLTTVQSYIDPEFEAYYDKLEKEQLSAMGIQAKQDGLANKPATLHHHKIQVIEPIKSTIQKAIEFNRSRYQPISHMAIAQSQRAQSSENITVKEKEKNAKEKEVLQLKDRQKELKATLCNGLSSKMRLIIPAAFAISEGIVVLNLLQGASFPFLVTFFLAIAIALAAGFGLHLGAHFIRKATTKIGARIRYAIVLSLAFLVAFALGVWRAHLYGDTVTINSQIDLNNVTGPAGPAAPTTYSPWPFILITFISFLVALAFEIKYWQTDDEKKKQKAYEDLSKECRKAEKEYKDMVEEINTLNAASTMNSGTVIRKQEYACSNEERLLTLAQVILSHYEGTNVEYRKDGSCPEFFGESITSDFKLYFSDIFNNLKQNK